MPSSALQATLFFMRPCPHDLPFRKISWVLWVILLYGFMGVMSWLIDYWNYHNAKRTRKTHTKSLNGLNNGKEWTDNTEPDIRAGSKGRDIWTHVVAKLITADIVFLMKWNNQRQNTVEMCFVVNSKRPKRV